jgi:hypothetical protein
MDVGSRHRAQEILKHLSIRLPHMAVLYECISAQHRYVISAGGLTYRLTCSESVLLGTPQDYVSRMLQAVVERIQLGDRPYRIHMRSMTMANAD